MHTLLRRCAGIAPHPGAPSVVMAKLRPIRRLGLLPGRFYFQGTRRAPNRVLVEERMFTGPNEFRAVHAHGLAVDVENCLFAAVDTSDHAHSSFRWSRVFSDLSRTLCLSGKVPKGPALKQDAFRFCGPDQLDPKREGVMAAR